MAEVDVFIDGLAEPKNPGTGTYGYVIYRAGRKIAEEAGLAGDPVTNNYAEYTALEKALLKLKEKGIDDGVVVKSDSKLVVGQLSQGWKVKGGGYLEKYKEVKELLKEFKSIRFVWIPRDDNAEADLLTRIAYGKFRRRAPS